MIKNYTNFDVGHSAFNVKSATSSHMVEKEQANIQDEWKQTRVVSTLKF